MRAILVAFTLALAGCSSGYDYVAEAELGSATVRVGLKHSHPFLAEYKRFLEVKHNGRVERKEIFPDTGGYAWLAVSLVGNAVELRSVGGLEHSWFFTADASTAAVRSYLGRFDFKRSSDGSRRYVFIPASEDPVEPRIRE